jgi:O-antigen ligase
MIGSGFLWISWRPRAAAGVFASLAAACGVFWIMVPLGTIERLGTIPEQLASSDWNDRLSIWTAGWNAFSHHPWIGSGAGTYAIASGLATGDTAHNTLMALLVTGGVAGTTLFLMAIAVVAAAIVRTRGLVRIALATTMTVWTITGMVGSVEENRATWLLFAMIVSAARLSAYPQCMLIFERGSKNCSDNPATTLAFAKQDQLR